MIFLCLAYFHCYDVCTLMVLNSILWGFRNGGSGHGDTLYLRCSQGKENGHIFVANCTALVVVVRTICTSGALKRNALDGEWVRGWSWWGGGGGYQSGGVGCGILAIIFFVNSFCLI